MESEGEAHVVQERVDCGRGYGVAIYGHENWVHSDVFL